MFEVDAIEQFHQQYPTPQEQVKLLLLMLGINDHDKLDYCDAEVCRNFLIEIALDEKFHKFLKYMRS